MDKKKENNNNNNLQPLEKPLDDNKDKIRKAKIGLYLVLAFILAVLLYNFGETYSKRHKDITFTVDNSKISIKNSGKPWTLASTPMGTTYVIEDTGSMSFVFMDKTYHDILLDAIDEYGYTCEEMSINNHSYKIYQDDEGYHYFITILGESSFCYIYGEDKDFIMDVLSKTTYKKS